MLVEVYGAYPKIPQKHEKKRRKQNASVWKTRKRLEYPERKNRIMLSSLKKGKSTTVLIARLSKGRTGLYMLNKHLLEAINLVKFVILQMTKSCQFWRIFLCTGNECVYSDRKSVV